MTKVEYIATIKGMKEATWLRGLVIELGVAQGVTIVFVLAKVHSLDNK